MPNVTSAEIETVDELQEIVAEAVQAAGGEPAGEDACPYGWDTAQGIIWLQTYRLTLDRIADCTESEAQAETAA